MAQVGEANRKDVRNAVVAAKAQPAWAKKFHLTDNRSTHIKRTSTSENEASPIG